MLRQPFSYYGGKSFMARDIKETVKPLIGKCNIFVDVFGGSGIVGLTMPKSWFHERIYNDIDKRLYNFFKVCQDKDKYKILIDKIEKSFHNQDIFEEFKNETTTEDEIESAFRFYYITKNSFNSGAKSIKTFISGSRNQMTTENIKSTFKNLQNFQIFNMDYRKLIEKFKSPKTIFYMDPPYLRGGTEYKHGNWKESDFMEMKRILDESGSYYLINESEADFPKLIPILGTPNFTKEYTSQTNTKQTKTTRTKRLEGFWFNFNNRGEMTETFKPLEITEPPPTPKEIPTRTCRKCNNKIEPTIKNGKAIYECCTTFEMITI